MLALELLYFTVVLSGARVLYPESKGMGSVEHAADYTGNYIQLYPHDHIV